MGGKIFKKRLRAAIARTGKTPNEVAAEAGISHFAIYSWLREEKSPNVYCLAAVADVLGVSMDWLWGRDQTCRKLSGS